MANYPTLQINLHYEPNLLQFKIRLVDDANMGTMKHFEYLFYVDFEASMAEVRAVEKCEMKRVVGKEKGKTLGGELERL